MSEFLSQQLS